MWANLDNLFGKATTPEPKMSLVEHTYAMFAGYKPRKLRESPNIYLTKYQLLCLLFAEKNKFLIGQSTKKFSVKTF